MVIERKNFITNAAAIFFVIVSFYMPDGMHKQLLASASVFALAGAVTNWLAIHMLFEKVPFLYGSGVIPVQFESFKSGIRNLIMEQFFTHETLSKYLQSEKISGDKIWSSVGHRIDYDAVFQALSNGVQESPMGGMLSMVGGFEVLNSLKPSIIPKLEVEFEKMVRGMDVNISEHSEDYISSVRNRVLSVIELRLDELTPNMVKEIIQSMIRNHLGWLVVWGGVFGAILGILAEVLNII